MDIWTLKNWLIVCSLLRESDIEADDDDPLFEKSPTLQDVLNKLDSLCHIQTTDHKVVGKTFFLDKKKKKNWGSGF